MILNIRKSLQNLYVDTNLLSPFSLELTYFIKCHPEQMGKPPSGVECITNRVYAVNGNMETRIELRKANENTGTSVTEWAYAPYLDYSHADNGPLVSCHTRSYIYNVVAH